MNTDCNSIKATIRVVIRVHLWLWSKPLTILYRPNKSEDQMSEVARWYGAASVGQNIDPVVVARVFRIAQQVTEVLHRYKRTEEEGVKHYLLLDECSQRLRSRK